MTIYFMGSEVAGLTPSDSSSFESTFSAGRESAFSRVSTEASADTAYVSAIPESALPDNFYVHFSFTQAVTAGATPDAVIMTLVNSSTEVFRIKSIDSDGTPHLQMQVRISGTWTDVGSSHLFSSGVIQHCDLYIAGNSGTGTATLYLAGSEVVTDTANLSLVTSIDSVRWYGVNTTVGTHVSQVIIADEPTIGWKLATLYPGGAGAETGWTGDYTGIDEEVFSDADGLTASTADLVETVTTAGATVTGYTVRAVGVVARAKMGASGPTQLQLALRSGSTTYFSASKALTLGYVSYLNVWETDPATSAAFLAANVSSLQPGVKSIT